MEPPRPSERTPRDRQERPSLRSLTVAPVRLLTRAVLEPPSGVEPEPPVYETGALPLSHGGEGRRGGWDRTTVMRLTGARSTVELHRQTGALGRPLHIAISVVREQCASRGPAWRRPRPRASRRRAEGARAPPSRPPLRAERGRACLPAPAAPPRRGEQAARFRGAAPARREGRPSATGVRHARHRRQGSNLRLRGQRPPSCHWTTPVWLDDPRGLEPPCCRLRGGCSAFELRVGRRGPERSRTSTSPLKRRPLCH